MLPDLAGQNAIVTGAGRGIGRAISLALARCGAHVLLTARTASQLEDTAAEIAAAGGLASVCAADLAVEQQIEQVFQQADQLGALSRQPGPARHPGLRGAARDEGHDDLHP